MSVFQIHRPKSRSLLWLLLFVFLDPAFAVDTESSATLEALEFFASENDSDALEVLTARILERRPDDLALVSKLLEFNLRKKDRKALTGLFNSFARKNLCPYSSIDAGPKEICQRLRALWTGNLDSIMFYEDTAVKLQKIRLQLRAGNCGEALSVLKDMEAKEGTFRLVLESYRDTYQCLGDTETAKVYGTRIERLRTLHSEE